MSWLGKNRKINSPGGNDYLGLESTFGNILAFEKYKRSYYHLYQQTVLLKIIQYTYLGLKFPDFMIFSFKKMYSCEALDKAACITRMGAGGSYITCTIIQC